MRTLLAILALVVCIQVQAFAQELVPEEPEASVKQDAQVLEEIETLVKQLGADDWQARDKAMARLAEIGAPAAPALVKARNSDDMEVKARAEKILEKLHWIAPEQQAEIEKLVTRYQESLDVKPAPDAQELVKQLESEDAAKREEAEKKLIELGRASLPAVEKLTKSDNAQLKALAGRIADGIRKGIKEFEQGIVEEIKKVKFSDFHLLGKLAPGTVEKSRQDIVADLLSGLLGLSYWNGPDNVMVSGNKLVVDGEEMPMPAGPWRLEEKGSRIYINGVEYILPVKVTRDVPVAQILGKTVNMDEKSVDLKACALDVFSQRRELGAIPYLIRALRTKKKNEAEDASKLQFRVVKALSRVVKDGPSCPDDDSDKAELEKSVNAWKAWWKEAKGTEPYKSAAKEAGR